MKFLQTYMKEEIKEKIREDEEKFIDRTEFKAVEVDQPCVTKRPSE